MIIKKVINNNLVIVGDKDEKILMGIGIGFGKKSGDLIEEKSILKEFTLTNRNIDKRLIELIDSVPLEVMSITETIIVNVKLELGKKVNDIIYIDICDHINSAINRFKEGIIIRNNLLPEIQRFYPKEYELSLKALSIINNEFSVELTEDEVGFIALHIVNATLTDSDHTYSYKITEMLKNVLNIIRRYFKVEFDEKSLYYYRFVTHLRYFGQRLFITKEPSKGGFSDLLEIIKEKYVREYNCALLIKEYMKKNYDEDISNEELLYLTIHIQRIIEESK